MLYNAVTDVSKAEHFIEVLFLLLYGTCLHGHAMKAQTAAKTQMYFQETRKCKTNETTITASIKRAKFNLHPTVL